MREKAGYLWIFEGFADWEPSHAVAELRRYGQYRMECVALTAEPIRSMGGVTVLPSKTLADVVATDVAVFILPGGERWETAPVEGELVDLLKTLDAADVDRGNLRSHAGDFNHWTAPRPTAHEQRSGVLACARAAVR